MLRYGKWEEWEIEYLKKSHLKRQRSEIALHLERPLKSVSNMCSMYGIRAIWYTKIEKYFSIEYARNMGYCDTDIEAMLFYNSGDMKKFLEKYSPKLNLAEDRTAGTKIASVHAWAIGSSKSKKIHGMVF